MRHAGSQSIEQEGPTRPGGIVLPRVSQWRPPDTDASDHHHPLRRQLLAMLTLALAYGTLQVLTLRYGLDYAVSLFPPAGIALGMSFVYGPAMLPRRRTRRARLQCGVDRRHCRRHRKGPWLPLSIALVKTLHAAVGRWLLRRWAGQPLLLDVRADLNLTRQHVKDLLTSFVQRGLNAVTIAAVLPVASSTTSSVERNACIPSCRSLVAARWHAAAPLTPTERVIARLVEAMCAGVAKRAGRHWLRQSPFD